MKKRNKKNSNIERARRGVKGLIIEWEDEDPLTESEYIKGRASHRNPIFALCANKVYEDFGNWIRHRQPFHWLVTITVVALYPDGSYENEIREVEAFMTLNNLNEHCMGAIEDAFRHANMDHYITTQFKAECIDTVDRRRKSA